MRPISALLYISTTFTIISADLGCDNGYIMPECPDSKYPQCFGVLKSLLGDGVCHDTTPYNTKECGYDDGDCVSTSTSTRFYSWAVAIAVALVFNVLICCCLNWKCGCREDSNNGSQTAEERRKSREEFVLSHIIRKSVKTVKDAQSKEEVCILPHEVELSRRSTHYFSKLSSLQGDSSLRNVSNHGLDEDKTISNIDENDEENQVGSPQMNKDNIYIESLHSIRTAMDVDVNVSQKDGNSLYSPRSCPICFETYQKGDEIAWSRNVECYHAFHVKCILYWLLDHDTCPMCRADYIFENGPSSGGSANESNDDNNNNNNEDS
jgi:hypothetical protein